jgi:hypothetical protein
MDSSVTRSKSDEFVFLSGNPMECVYEVLPNSTDDLVASLQVDVTKFGAMGQRLFRENVILITVVCL